SDAVIREYLMSADGKVIVTVDKGTRRIKSWNAASGRHIAVFEWKTKQREARAEAAEAEERTVVLALSPDGQSLLFSDSNEVAIWKTDGRQEPVTLGKHGADVSAIAFSPYGKWVASGDETGRAKIWDAASHKELATFTAFKASVSTLAFSPDAKTLASGG